MMDAFSTVAGLWNALRRPPVSTVSPPQPPLRMAQYIMEENLVEEDDGLSDEDRPLYEEWRRCLQRTN